MGTCGCIDHRQNFRPRSVGTQSINTSAEHILRRSLFEIWGESLATACGESTAPLGWLKSERQSYGISPGTQVPYAVPAGWLKVQLHSMLWETARLLAQRRHWHL